MSKKEEIAKVVDEIVKYNAQIIRCMELMVEKGDKIYEGLDLEESLAFLKEHPKTWFEARQKLDLIKDEIIDGCTDDDLCVNDLIRDRDNSKNTAKSAQDVCKSLYGYYYE